jgi:hypothetical protein
MHISLYKMAGQGRIHVGGGNITVLCGREGIEAREAFRHDLELAVLAIIADGQNLDCFLLGMHVSVREERVRDDDRNIMVGCAVCGTDFF